MESRYFLTVDWCGKGNRGIFCSAEGNTFSKAEEPHTDDEMFETLDVFLVILNPKSELLSEDETKEFNRFIPLHEYSDRYGIAVKIVSLLVEEVDGSHSRN